MKKYWLGLVLMAIWILMLGISMAKAEINIVDELKKLPAINQAVIFSFDKNEFDYASTISLTTLFNEKVKLDIGYTPKQELIGAISFKLAEVKDYLKFPILDWIIVEPFIYIGWDRISGINTDQDGNSEFDKGLGIKVISLKF